MSAYPLPRRRYSIQEYIEICESSDEKYEFFDGEIVPWESMAGASRAHSHIATNVSSELRTKFVARGKRCGTLDSDALLAIPQLRRYRFPDLTVQCDDTIYDEQFKTAGTNPTLVIEIVSDSSRLDDYSHKLVQYGLIESLRDYVIIEQAAAVVIVYSRSGSDEKWEANPYTKLDQMVRFPSVDTDVLMAELYRDIVWADGEAEFVPGAGLPTEEPPIGDAPMWVVREEAMG